MRGVLTRPPWRNVGSSPTASTTTMMITLEAQDDKPEDDTPEGLWRRAGHWLYLRWKVRRDRKDWPDIHTPPEEEEEVNR